VIGALRQIALGAALAFIAAAAVAAVSAAEPGDMAIGRAKAPVTIVEYASVGCPHCAEWDRTVFPTVKAKLLDTGRARFVVREMITGDATVATGGFMVARCAGPAKYFDVVEAIYRRQGEMLGSGGKAGQVLAEIAKTVGGLDQSAFEACISDQKGLDALDARVAQHSNVDKIDSTPTFFVGERKLEGDQTFDQLAQAVRVARRRPG
jgi:protein-disulfide isomerase